MNQNTKVSTLGTCRPGR